MPFDQQNLIDDLDLGQRKKFRSFDQKKIQALIILYPKFHRVFHESWYNKSVGGGTKKKELLFGSFGRISCPKTTAFTIKFRKTYDSKFPSDKLARLAVKIKPAVLKTRSQAADEAKALLYSLAITIRIREMCRGNGG